MLKQAPELSKLFIGLIVCAILFCLHFQSINKNIRLFSESITGAGGFSPASSEPSKEEEEKNHVPHRYLLKGQCIRKKEHCVKANTPQDCANAQRLDQVYFFFWGGQVVLVHFSEKKVWKILLLESFTKDHRLQCKYLIICWFISQTINIVSLQNILSLACATL